ncbi:unnamed protein product [Polarella glacialis]|uniref:Uncharacterized protein n=2 Tax=Polarella glacialis TaxID=89957 RepID=A0A813GH26_POLGL|nr:unnamed protein product [Polarella glacialis]|mmetsp:Transcript_6933/g.13028  ORF Transcript_6933/g.13028 Transcript_6933/m.13028 type:complete len:232 (+) Transcript_6933:59-754(+)
MLRWDPATSPAQKCRSVATSSSRSAMSPLRAGRPSGLSLLLLLVLSLCSSRWEGPEAIAWLGSAPCQRLSAGGSPPGRGSRVQRNFMVGQPTERPAYGFEKMSPLGPNAATGEVVPGMEPWLKHLGLEDYLPEANAWCTEQGASVMSEVMESFKDFAEALGLSEEELAMLKRRARISFSTLQQRGEIPAQEPVLKMEEFKVAGKTFLRREETPESPGTQERRDTGDRTHVR